MPRVHNPEFVKAYDTFREHYDWFSRRRMVGDLSIPDTKEAVAEMREFVDRWQGRTGLAEMDRGLEKFAELVAGLERALERDATEKLIAVVEKRGDCVVGELILKASVTFIELMKEVPDEMRPELLRIHRESMGKDFDPETDYRESEEDAESHRQEFEQAWGSYVADWPERATPELRQRAATVEGDPLGAWLAELRATLARLS